MVGCWRRPTLVLALGIGLAACGGARTDQPIVITAPLRTIADACPDAEVVARGDGAPTFIRLINDTDQPVGFTLDRCIRAGPSSADACDVPRGPDGARL